MLSRNSHAFAAIRFSLARLGAVLVPINFMLNTEEVSFILRSSGARALAVGPDFLELGRSASALGTKVEQLYWLAGEELVTPPSGLLGFDDLLNNNTSPPRVQVDARSLRRLSIRAEPNLCLKAPCSITTRYSGSMSVALSKVKWRRMM